MYDHEGGPGGGDDDGDLGAERVHEVGCEDEGGGYRAVEGEVRKGSRGTGTPCGVRGGALRPVPREASGNK